MGFLRTDYSEVNAGFGALPVGEYECIISEVKMTQSKAGNEMIKVTLTIRDDVEQEGRKRKFFDNLVVMDNMMWKFQQVAKATQLPAGFDFESAADFANAIQYRLVRVKNKHEEYNGEQQDRVAWYAEPKFGENTSEVNTGGNAGAANPFAGNGSIDISDDDFPF